VLVGSLIWNEGIRREVFMSHEGEAGRAKRSLLILKGGNQSIVILKGKNHGARDEGLWGREFGGRWI
jgi:hypothetical protein